MLVCACECSVFVCLRMLLVVCCVMLCGLFVFLHVVSCGRVYFATIVFMCVIHL